MSALLETLPAPSGSDPPWLRGLREGAARRLRDVGLPTPKTEQWRFTPLRPLLSPAWAPPRAVELPDGFEIPAVEEAETRVTIVDGRVVAIGEAPAGVRALRLIDALRVANDLVEPHLGRVAAREHFAALNAAAFEDVVVVLVDPRARVERTVHLAYVSASPGPAACYPRALVVVGDGAELRLAETHVDAVGGEHLTSSVTEVVVGTNAGVDHLRVHDPGAARLVARLAVSQSRDSRYTSRVVALGGATARLDVDVSLEGPGAECRLDGVYHVDGEDHVASYTRVEHRAPRCTSHQAYRGILDGRGSAVFDGTVIVHRDSQQTDAHQENRNLLLSDRASIHTKPHLEIDADDVKCSHGATVGTLDEDQLFYLRTRGIPPAPARAILTYAFVRAIVDRVAQPLARERLAERMRQRLPEGAALSGAT